MTPRRGSQRASFGLHARGNAECRAVTIGLAPAVGRPQSLVDLLLSPATPEPPGSGDACHRSLPVVIELKRLPSGHRRKCIVDLVWAARLPGLKPHASEALAGFAT